MNNFCCFFLQTDPVNVLYKQNEVTPVDYLQFKHHSYSEMVDVSFPAKFICWLIEFQEVRFKCSNINCSFILSQFFI